MWCTKGFYSCGVNCISFYITGATKESESCENLHGLLNVRTLRLLHFLSLWTKDIDKLSSSSPGNHSKEINKRRKRNLKANEDIVSMLLTREKKRSSSLPDSRAPPTSLGASSASSKTASSGVELLTDQLVSSIMGEITGKSSQVLFKDIYSNVSNKDTMYAYLIVKKILPVCSY